MNSKSKKASFASVGGLDGHLKIIRDNIILPLTKPELIGPYLEPPRGILFYGPPGTGKTLLANACAKEASRGNRKVKLFFYNGSNILSMYLGESERKVKKLFENARQCKPAIIFFDEIDGLAPARTARMEHSHCSIVSVILSCMDGIEKNDGVVVIGTTNRLEAIDPALRRPGRFDLELKFNLPSAQGRAEIIKILTKQWPSRPSQEMIDSIAEKTVGYNGSDLKGLCYQAGTNALNRSHPNIHEAEEGSDSKHKKVVVTLDDFDVAISEFQSTSSREGTVVAKKLSSHFEPLVKSNLNRVIEHLRVHCANKVVHPHLDFDAVHQDAPHLLLISSDEKGMHNHLVPALFYQLEHLTVHTLDTSSLFAHGEQLSPSAACEKTLRMVVQNKPALLYLPYASKWWELVDEVTRVIFTEKMSQIMLDFRVIVVATATRYQELPEEMKELFPLHCNCTLLIPNPSAVEREAFFFNLFAMTTPQHQLQLGQPLSEPQPSTTSGRTQSALSRCSPLVDMDGDHQIALTSRKSAQKLAMIKLKKSQKRKVGGGLKKTKKKLRMDIRPDVTQSSLKPTTGRCEPRFDEMSTSTLSTLSRSSSSASNCSRYSEETNDDNDLVDVSLGSLLSRTVELTEGFPISKIENTNRVLKTNFMNWLDHKDEISLLKSLHLTVTHLELCNSRQQYD